MEHEHITPERITEIANGSEETPEELQKEMECDYCAESVLQGEDLDQYNARRKKH